MVRNTLEFPIGHREILDVLGDVLMREEDGLTAMVLNQIREKLRDRDLAKKVFENEHFLIE